MHDCKTSTRRQSLSRGRCWAYQPDLLVLPVEIVDLANCAAWDMPFEARALPAWDAIIKKLDAAVDWC